MRRHRILPRDVTIKVCIFGYTAHLIAMFGHDVAPHELCTSEKLATEAAAEPGASYLLHVGCAPRVVCGPACIGEAGTAVHGAIARTGSLYGAASHLGDAPLELPDLGAEAGALAVQLREPLLGGLLGLLRAPLGPVLRAEQRRRRSHLRKLQITSLCHFAEPRHHATHRRSACRPGSTTLPHKLCAVFRHACRDLWQLPRGLQERQLRRAHLLEWQPLCEELEEDHRKGVYIRLLRQPSNPLVKHFRWCPNRTHSLQCGLDHGVLPSYLCKAKVAQLGCPHRRTQHVWALEVKMEDSLAVQVLDTPGNVKAKRQRLREGEWLGQRHTSVTMQQAGKAPCLDILSNHEQTAAATTHLCATAPKPDNVWVIQLRKQCYLEDEVDNISVRRRCILDFLDSDVHSRPAPVEDLAKAASANTIIASYLQLPGFHVPRWSGHLAGKLLPG
mmetsp:Transcript_125684/g.350109  ORF Transcript_125684/g.350109 Transcript_125684/m.350109 type:complete len:445 (+) Transcript_125684:327-1661(+)